MLDIVDADTNTILKKNLFLQCLFCDDLNIRERKIGDKLGVDMRVAKSCFASLYPIGYKNYVEVKISEGIEIWVRDEEANKTKLEILQAELWQLDLDYLANICSFLLQPSFGKYQQLYNQLGKEEEYIRKKYKSILKEYAGNVFFDTEKEFNDWILARGADYEELIKGEVKGLQCREIGVEFITIVYHNSVLSELAEGGTICFEELSILNQRFFEVYIFAAEVQIEQMQQVSDMVEKMAQHIIDIICEAIRRGYYGYHMYEMIGNLLASKYKKELWSRVPDLVFAEQMIQQELLQQTEIYWDMRCIGEEELQNIISNIIDKLIYDEKESSYLSIIPLLIHRKIDLGSCITKRNMRKLEQMEYVIGANILSMKLLQMCMTENDEPHKLIEEILSVNIPHKAIFMELENMLRYCRVENKEKIWVVVYQKLESEDFEGCQQIRNRIMKDMMEARCNAVTR